jgi:hypothetical protein
LELKVARLIGKAPSRKGGAFSLENAPLDRMDRITLALTVAFPLLRPCPPQA